MFKRKKEKKFWRKLLDFIYPRIGVNRSMKYTGHRLGRMNSSPYKIACGFACGAGISFTPFLGLHFILSGIMAYLLRGSIIASAIGTFIGNPLTFPFIWALVYSTGSLMVGVDTSAHNIGELFNFALEKISEINSWHLLFLSDYSTAINTVSDYLKMWSDLFNVLYIFIIGSLPWVAIVWFTFFISIYILVKNYKEKRKFRKKKN
ncbi:MAG: DUF2062 domain-containing protein [Alphaproteobacteria bacterium]